MLEYLLGFLIGIVCLPLFSGMIYLLWKAVQYFLTGFFYLLGWLIILLPYLFYCLLALVVGMIILEIF